MRVPKRWRMMPHDAEKSRRLADELRLPPVLAQLLINRGNTDAAAVKNFLGGSLSQLHDPQQLPGVPAAAEFLHQAVKAGKRICVYGDYDVDGITGATLLWRALRLAEANASYYVPERLEEGYGLSSGALERFKDDGIDVVITVDCGITAVAEAQRAKELGIDLIVTDHHEMKDELPAAQALVHPRLPGSTYPFLGLCGAGVAFKLAWALAQQFSQARKVSEAFRSFLMESVALVALGTVADVVPILDENRLFVRFGLKSLKEAPSLGLKALLAACGLTDPDKKLEAEDIGFKLAPRLNAAGRLGTARLAIELLGTTSEARALDLARYLCEQNEQRQSVERKIYHAAKEQVEALGDLDHHPTLVLADENWHPGVIGIVASRLVDRYARPVIMLCSKDDPCQGSGRSVDGFPLHDALAACKTYLLSHGGHAMAAGVKIERKRIADFRAALNEFAAGKLRHQPKQMTLNIDAEVPLTALTHGLLKGLDALHPHGVGNRRPLFMTGELQLAGEPRKVGGGERHLSFRVKQPDGTAFKAIAFGMADRADELVSAQGQCCLVYTPKRNTWNGFTSIDLEVQDFQPGPRAQLD